MHSHVKNHNLGAEVWRRLRNESGKQGKNVSTARNVRVLCSFLLKTRWVSSIKFIESCWVYKINYLGHLSPEKREVNSPLPPSFPPISMYLLLIFLTQPSLPNISSRVFSVCRKGSAPQSFFKLACSKAQLGAISTDKNPHSHEVCIT